MKKVLILALLMVLSVSLTACGSGETEARGMTVTATGTTVEDILENGGEPADEQDPVGDAEGGSIQGKGTADMPVDIDLTTLSSTMVYSEVYDIMMDPASYVGKVIRMEGRALSSYYEETDQTYYCILITDATACCAQGIEYVLEDGDVYPADNDTARIVGTFQGYEEGGTTWYHLVGAVREA